MERLTPVNAAAPATRLRLATVWLGGCSGCHMSFLDLDEYLIELASLADVVWSPLVDRKDYPYGVDVVLVEGAVANEHNLEMIRAVRHRSRVLLSFGDCAVTGNVTALRNPLGAALPVLARSYQEDHPGARIPGEPGPSLGTSQAASPSIVPRLLDRVRPLHEVVRVDGYLPGCPPPAPRIRAALEAVLAGQPLALTGADLRFG